ncbi:MAG: molecular chaperone SurA, partial [Gammaproteobacteria bacterium]|nr:molecular chaperone SurA [Gammaproteobacteria bacterium]
MLALGVRCLRHSLSRLVSIAALTVAVQTAPAFAQIEMLDRVVAIVDDDIILTSELQESLETVRATLEARGVEMPEDEVLVRETLDRLILDSIQMQLANRYGVRIPDQQLDEAMTRLARQNGLTLEQFRVALEQSGQNYAMMREDLRDDLAIQRVQQGNVMRNINISEQEIDNFLTTEEGEAMTQPEYRVIQALLASSKSDARDEAEAKEAYVDQLLASIEAGQAFEEAVSATGSYTRKLGDIPSMFAEVVPTLSIGDVAKVKSSSGFHLVYLADALGGERLVKQTDVRHILIKPTEVLDESAAADALHQIASELFGGADFGALARQYSDDIGSAA